ncbi:MAG: transcriptional regulator, partial [Solirubrobacterales bacterium]|nr:transcriptional regulator [Solirubrobacterales bacterium]
RAAAGRAPAGGTVALPALSLFDYLLASADDTAARLVAPRVRAFIAEDRKRHGTLVATLQGFVEADLNVRRAAALLHIHENTMQYRLTRIAERTGLGMRNVRDLIELIVAADLLGRSEK